MAKKLVPDVSRISLRGLVFAAGLILTLAPWHFKILEQADESLLRFGTYLVETPKGSSNTAVVQIPQFELDEWQQDINRAGRFAALLSNILHSPNSLVGVLFDKPIDARTGLADELIETVTQAASESSADSKALHALVQHKQFLLEFLRSERVVLGATNISPEGQKPLTVEEGPLTAVPFLFKHYYWQDRSLTKQTAHVVRPTVDHYPVFTSGTNKQYAVAPIGESESVGSFLTYYLYAEQRFRNGSARLAWREDKGLQIGDSFLPTSPAGDLMPLYGLNQRMMPLIDLMTIEDALARAAFPDRVLIAAEGDDLALKMAATWVSIDRGAILTTPWWYMPAVRLLLFCITLYAVFLIPRLALANGFLVTTLLLFVLIVAQLGAEATQKLWLPLAAPILWAFIAHMLILIWQRQARRWRSLLHRADHACLEYGRFLFDQGQWDKAIEANKSASTSDAQLQLFYKISNAFASKRQYKQAVDTLKEIRKRRARYKDVEQKIDALLPMISTSGKNLAKTRAIDATVVLDKPNIERPRLGRYEIREELGRGAMGTVYLGYDPRISRQVAVKTLSYNHFQEKELEDIKARFFREAEAAGRLNHPNIVSVFDVGEEQDLAYIAMDFAEGSPLSAFTEHENLLPAFEVYRIICDVADALEYAHGNNIVHRDIKPGNIMYNPSPYKLKVTDFGIARLMDDSRTSTGEILGSPLYMAPEQLKGKKVNYAADVFSLGVTFYQLLCGKLPFDGDNLASLTYEIIHGKHRGVRTVRKDLPTSASRIVNQALQKNPEDRYESANEMAQVIKKAIKRDFAHEAKRAGFL